MSGKGSARRRTSDARRYADGWRRVFGRGRGRRDPGGKEGHVVVNVKKKCVNALTMRTASHSIVNIGAYYEQSSTTTWKAWRQGQERGKDKCKQNQCQKILGCR